MKRRIVAVVLSLALCMGGTLEAGAAALGTPEVQAVVETEQDQPGTVSVMRQNSSLSLMRHQERVQGLR